MIYSKQMFNFNVPENLFITDPVYTAFSRIGTFSIDGYVGPDSANAIAYKKIESIKKAYSEMLERRALMAGGIEANGKVIAVNILKNRVEHIDKKFSTYSHDRELMIDTTGTAAHFDTTSATFLALKELMEKNSLFLFWYGFQGRYIKNQDVFLKDHPIYKIIMQSGKTIKLFVNDSFYPLKVVVAFIVSGNKINASGVGSSFKMSSAIEKSVEEAYLLQWKNESVDIIEKNQTTQVHTNVTHGIYLDHLSKFEGCNYYNLDCDKDKNNINLLLSCLPNWIQDIFMIPLCQVINHNVKCVKIFSEDMFNHIPKKNNINVKNKFNINTINICEKDLSILPNCIVD